MNPVTPRPVQHAWQQKNPWLAGILAWLVPGAGHFYQGRTFKGVLYLVCILGTYLYGQHLGNWRVVYNAPESGRVSLSYLGQVLVGLPSLPALLQARRAAAPQRPLDDLETPLSKPFTGGLIPRDRGEGLLEGTVTLEPVEGHFGAVAVRGAFTGMLDGQPVELPLGDYFRLAPRLGSDPQRLMEVEVLTADGAPTGRRIFGFVPRPLTDWFLVPPTKDELEELHGSLGKFYDLAVIFTCIAGLLNVLAIWDALEGPAYGYGDEELAHRPDAPAEATASQAMGSPDHRPAARSQAEAALGAGSEAVPAPRK